MSEFECDTPFFRSKLTRNVVITQLGPDAFSIFTDSETRSEYLKFVDAVGNSPGAKDATGYYATGYYMRGLGEEIVKKGPFIDRFKDYADLAYQEDEEFILLLRAIIKVIDPWR